MKPLQITRWAVIGACLILGQTLNAGAPIYTSTPDFTVDLTNITAAKNLFPENLIIDNNGDTYYTWTYGVTGVSYECNAELPADDWLVSKRIATTPGHKYQVEITTRANLPRYPERIEVAIAYNDVTRANPQDLSLTVINPTIVTSPVTLTSQAIPAGDTGYIQIGLHAISDADMATLIVSSVTVKDITDQFAGTNTLTISNLSAQTDANGTLTAGYTYPLDITLTNNLTDDTLPGTLILTCGIEQPVKLSYPAITAGHSYTLHTTCTPSLFEGNTYPITAIIDSDETSTEPTTTYIDLLRPIHPVPLHVTCRNLWQYEVLVQWQAPATTASLPGAMLVSPADKPGQLTHYNIYRDQQLVGQVAADTHEFYDFNTTSNRSTYHVTAQYENGTSDLSDPTTIDVLTNIAADIKAPQAISINARTLTINTPGQITITDIAGHTIYTATQPIPGTTLSLAPGLYIISTTTGTAKVIIK